MAATTAGIGILKWILIAIGAGTASEVASWSEDKMKRKFKRTTGFEYNQGKVLAYMTYAMMTGTQATLEGLKEAWNREPTVDDYQKIAAHINDTQEWDEERNKLDRFANQNAEKAGIPVSQFIADVKAEDATQKWDEERNRLNELANSNAESTKSNIFMTPFEVAHSKASTNIDTERQSIADRAGSVAGWETLLPNLETKPVETPSDDKPQEDTVISPPVSDGVIDVPQEVPKQEEVVTPIPGDTTIDVPKEETPQPPTEEKKDEEDKIGVPTITDKTEENIEQAINYGWNMDQWIAYMENAQKKQWEREDQIRQEGYEREDTAYTRAVADMKRAGINPNLMNVQPADSGTGITNATGMDYAGLTKQMETTTNLLMKMIDREFQGDENTKKNFTSLISAIIQGMFMMGTFSK